MKLSIAHVALQLETSNYLMKMKPKSHLISSVVYVPVSCRLHGQLPRINI